MIRTGYMNHTSHHTVNIPLSGKIKNIQILLWIKSDHYISVQKMYMIITARPLVSLQVRNGTHVTRTGKGPCRREYWPVQMRSGGTIEAGTTCDLRTTTALCSTWHYTLLLLFYHVSYERNRSYEKRGSFQWWWMISHHHCTLKPAIASSWSTHLASCSVRR